LYIRSGVWGENAAADPFTKCQAVRNMTTTGMILKELQPSWQHTGHDDVEGMARNRCRKLRQKKDEAGGCHQLRPPH